MDEDLSRGCAHVRDPPKSFKHPAVHSSMMFFGEFMCLMLYFALGGQRASAAPPSRKRRKKQEGLHFRKVVAFALPAMCDAVATTLLNIGLYYTNSSTFQMLRGCLVLWAGLFTLIVVRRPLYIHHWMGMLFIATGAALVGAASILYMTPTMAKPPTGNTQPPPPLDNPLYSDMLSRTSSSN
eukprot:gene26425-17525_t